MTIPPPQTNAQRRAITALAARFGAPTYITTMRYGAPTWVDFDPCDSRPYGSSWRITPDGVAEECTDALLS